MEFRTYSIKEACGLFGFSYSFMRSLILGGQVPYHIAGKDRYFFTESDLKEILDITERRPTADRSATKQEAENDTCHDS